MNKTYSKKAFVQYLVDTKRFKTKKSASISISNIFDSIAEIFHNGDSVVIRNFGKFSPNIRNKRIVVCGMNDKKYISYPKKVLQFTPAKPLKIEYKL
jgi:nucleoid DNA-binding protein